MKTKNKDTFHSKNLEELKGLLNETRDALLSLRLEKMQKKLKNTRAIFLKRKEIARILSTIREKEFEGKDEKPIK